MSIGAGTRVSLAYVREYTRGTTPAGVGTPKTDVAAVASGGASGYSKFTRASGSWITDGYVAGQHVISAGFTTTANNGTWLVSAVSATDLTVVDSGDVITDEAADVSQSIQISLETLRATGRNINLQKNILESAEVRSDRQKSDVRHGFNRVEGAPGFELSLGAYNDMLELALSRGWVAVASVSPGNLGVNSSGYFTRASGSWITDGFRAGDIIRTALFTNAANNADWRVSSVTADKIYVVVPSGVTMVTESASGTPTLVYPGKRLDVGTVLATMTMERQFSDLGKYQVFKGVAIDQISLSIQPEAIIGGTISLIGMSADAMASSSISTSSPNAAAQNSPFAAFDGSVYEAGSSIAVATGLDFTLVNNRRLAPVIGSRFSPDVFEGTCEITGTLTAYFQDDTLFNKFVNETESSIWMRLQDPNTTTSFMSLVFPRVKYNGGDMDPPQEGPVPISMPFRALVQTGLAAASGATVASSLTIQRSDS